MVCVFLGSLTKIGSMHSNTWMKAALLCKCKVLLLETSLYCQQHGLQWKTMNFWLQEKISLCVNISIQEIKNRQNKNIDVKQITVMLTLLKSFFVVSGRKWNCFQTANISQSFHAPTIFVIGFLLVFAKCSDEQIKVQTQGERQSFFLDFANHVFHSAIQSNFRVRLHKQMCTLKVWAPTIFMVFFLLLFFWGGYLFFYRPAALHASSQLTGFVCWLMAGDRVQSERDRRSKNGSSYLPCPSARDAALPQGCLDVMCACIRARGAYSLLYLYEMLLISGCKPCWLERGCLFCCTVPGMVVSNRGTAVTAGNGKCFIHPS